MAFTITADSTPILDGWGWGDYWTLGDWVLWHRRMVPKWGVKHANYKVEQIWPQASGFGTADYTQFNAYFKAQGTNVSGRNILDVTSDTADSVWSGFTGIFKNLPLIAGAGLVGYIVYDEWRANRRIRAAATYGKYMNGTKTKPKAKGNNNMVIAGIAISGLALMAFTNKPTPTEGPPQNDQYPGRTPLGARLQDSKEIYEAHILPTIADGTNYLSFPYLGYTLYRTKFPNADRAIQRLSASAGRIKYKDELKAIFDYWNVTPSTN